MRFLAKTTSVIVFGVTFLQYIFMGVTLERMSIMALALILYIISTKER